MLNRNFLSCHQGNILILSFRHRQILGIVNFDDLVTIFNYLIVKSVSQFVYVYVKTGFILSAAIFFCL